VSFETVVVAMFVSMLMMVILACGTAAPEASVTVPEMVPRSDCANSVAFETSSAKAKAKTRTTEDSFMVSP